MMVHKITGVRNVLLLYGFHLLSGHSVLKMFIRLKIKLFISETYTYFFNVFCFFFMGHIWLLFSTILFE